MTQTIDGDGSPTPEQAAAEEKAARRLLEALHSRVACDPVREFIGSTDLPAAYRVQERLTRGRVAGGAKIVGRKIGLTSKAVQEQMGVDQPDFGVLFDDMDFAPGQIVPMGHLLQPKAEAEVAFVLGKDLAEGPLDHAQMIDAIDYGMPAIEICDSRIRGWDIHFGDTVADNASAGVYVLGEPHKTLDEFTPVEVGMRMLINGEEVSTGTGADCLGDPLNAVAWLAKAARDFGEPLRAGQVILSGALGPMRPISPGDEVTVEITGLGSVTARFSEGNDK